MSLSVCNILIPLGNKMQDHFGDDMQLINECNCMATDLYDNNYDMSHSFFT
jgi:hypothetical protein